PRSIPSSLRHGMPPRAWQGPALVVRASRAVQPVHVPSGIRHVLDNNSTVRATRGQAGEALPGVHSAAERMCRSVPPQEPHTLLSQSAMRPKRYACLLHVGYAQVSPGASEATPALYEDG